MRLLLSICVGSILHSGFTADIASAGCITALVQEEDEGDLIAKSLLEESDLQMQGHPFVLGDLLFFLSSDNPVDGDRWKIQLAIEPDRIVIYRFYGKGVCRRSALRLLLAKSGLGIVVHSKGTLVTLQQIAKSNWTARTRKPEVDDLRDPDVKIRREAAYSAGYWRLPDVWLNPLIKALSDDDRDVRFNAAFAIASFGVEATPAIANLGRMLESADHSMQEVAAHVLTRIGKPALPELIRVAEGTDSHAVTHALNAIANMGLNARSARPILLAMANGCKITETQTNEDDALRHAIGVALANMYVPSDIDSLKKMLGASTTEERELAARIIAEVGSAATDCEPILQSMLLDPIVAVRRAAARALNELDLPETTNTKQLEIASKDSDPIVASWASAALKRVRAKQDQE